MAKFNGHKNWNHWNVSLWINNDEGLYRLALDCIRHNQTRSDAAREMMAMLPSECTPDGGKYNETAIRAAMVGMEA